MSKSVILQILILLYIYLQAVLLLLPSLQAKHRKNYLVFNNTVLPQFLSPCLFPFLFNCTGLRLSFTFRNKISLAGERKLTAMFVSNSQIVWKFVTILQYVNRYLISICSSHWL